MDPPFNVFFSTSAYFVNGNTQLMSDLTDNQFYPSAERIWLCIRLNWAKWFCDRLTEDADFGKKILFSDEADFDLGGYVNKQQKIPHVYIEKPRYPKRVAVWCGFLSRGIIGPFIFENKQGETVTVNGDRYRPKLNEFLFTKVAEEDIANIWFQQDGATCHTAEATLDVLSPVFEDRIISRRADAVWPPRSYDLTPLDYYLWCAVKGKCDADKPETIDTLKDNIHEGIGEIQLHTIENVLKNWTALKIGYCMASRGSLLNEIIFHY